MCGLLGEFGKVITEKKDFEAILRLSKQRGPDMTGYFNYINRIADGLGVDLEPEMEP